MDTPAAPLLTFTYLPQFERSAKGLLTDADLQRIEASIQADPQRGDVEAGTGGWRKLRIALPGRGKSGGARVLYLLVLLKGRVFMLDVYAKSRASDVNDAAKAGLRRLAASLAEEP